MGIPCFFMEMTDRQAVFLRRYRSCRAGSACPLMPGEYSRHDAMNSIAELAIQRTPEGYIKSPDIEEPPHDDPRWPTHCPCGYAFAEPDEWQVFGATLYRRADTGEVLRINDAPPGALWHADWLAGHYAPTADGHIVMCRTPGGDWNIDSEASNCDKKGDRTHHCWCRHGDPTDPLGLKTGQPFHVDKSCQTCNAGAGSIACGNYHGFLHRGQLT
jgi:hypothetical protein